MIMHEQYQAWLKLQPVYKTLVFQYGSQVFIHEYGAYKILAVEVGYLAWIAKNEVKPCNQEN